MKPSQLEVLDAMADEIVASMKGEESAEAAEEAPRTRYVCKVCGYVYEGDELPEDYTCPLCKKGKDFFAPEA